MRVFISGIAGFLGSHLADEFLASGDEVSGVDNLIGGYSDNVPDGCTWYVGDCNDLDKLKKAMRGSELVFHLAATAHEGLSVFSPHENAHHGYAASAAVFSAACAVGARRVVFASSMARYGLSDGKLPFREDSPALPEDPYGIGKLAAEKLLINLAETHGVEWSIAVPHNIYGPRQYVDPYRNVLAIWVNRMLQGRQPVIYGDGSNQRSFSYISDDVAPLVAMGVQDNAARQLINIGPDEEDERASTILQACQTTASVLGFRLDPIFMPERPREVKRAYCSAEKARKLLGYRTTVPLIVGVGKLVEWMRARGPRTFQYNLDIEIDSPLLPETWGKRLF